MFYGRLHFNVYQLHMMSFLCSPYFYCSLSEMTKIKMINLCASSYAHGHIRKQTYMIYSKNYVHAFCIFWCWDLVYLNFMNNFWAYLTGNWAISCSIEAAPWNMGKCIILFTRTGNICTTKCSKTCAYCVRYTVWIYLIHPTITMIKSVLSYFLENDLAATGLNPTTAVLQVHAIISEICGTKHLNKCLKELL